MSVILQPAFILHRRHYRETSFILELFTRDYGRISALARGIRKTGSRSAALLQLFTPLLLSFRGKGELVTLNQIEADGFFRPLSGKNLHCGFYLNELLMRLLSKQDPHAELFIVYRNTLEELQKATLELGMGLLRERILRSFEKKLLAEIGYGLPLNKGLKFDEELFYFFDVERGFLPCPRGEINKTSKRPIVFSGSSLNTLLNDHLVDNCGLQELKRLMRFILDALLGRPLESRNLFR
jgi:DNA repair protein RecO (recombination protein O)